MPAATPISPPPTRADLATCVLYLTLGGTSLETLHTADGVDPATVGVFLRAVAADAVREWEEREGRGGLGLTRVRAAGVS